MFLKRLYVVLVVLLVINSVVAKKIRRTKRPKPEDEDTTSEPNVVTYSNFGFNDVGSFDGFVPSSPDYASYLSSFNEESTTRLYAPAFPTAQDARDSTAPQTFGQTLQLFGPSGDDRPQANLLHYQPNFGNLNLDNNENQNNYFNNQPSYDQKTDETNSQVYGTKLAARFKNKPYNPYNNTDYSIFNSGTNAENYPNYQHERPSSPEAKPYTNQYNENAYNFKNQYEENDKNQYTENSNNNPKNMLNSPPTYPPSSSDDNSQVVPNEANTNLKFSKVVDFTKNIPNYPTELQGNMKYPVGAAAVVSKTPSGYTSVVQDHNSYVSQENKFLYPSGPHKNTYNIQEEHEPEKDYPKPELPKNQDYSMNYVGYPTKGDHKGTKLNAVYKDKFKYKPWLSSNYSNDDKESRKPLKGFEYSTNYSKTRFKFDFDNQKPFGNSQDEIVPASSNIVDLENSYQFPDTDYSTFKKIPPFKGNFDDDYGSNPYFKPYEKYKNDDYSNRYKEYQSPVKGYQSPVKEYQSSSWDNGKGGDYLPYKTRKPQFTHEYSDDVVHIPKRPYKQHGKPSEWSSYTKHKPRKPKHQPNDWGKEVHNTRFKSEEDLLDLRNHDTSYPSYLPSYRPLNDAYDENDYKKLVEKWKQSYLKAKYKDSLRDYESYASDAKPVHVPIPKPYAIEIPQPIIVPVPKPYPVHVPVPKPVAVPVIQELKIAIEKPIPYPVIKKVPYPVEKPVPVPVEKQVPVPVVKPYPVPVPHIRPVFHHSRPREELDESEEDENDYFPRAEETKSKRVPYAKRPRNTRTRSRRPFRPSSSYYDRNRRRWPAKKPAVVTRERTASKRPRSSYNSEYYSSPYRHYEVGPEDDDQDHRDYLAYCKRSGNC